MRVFAGGTNSESTLHKRVGTVVEVDSRKTPSRHCTLWVLHQRGEVEDLRTPAVDVGVANQTPTPTAGARGRARHREVPRTPREQPSKAPEQTGPRSPSCQGNEATDAHTSRGAAASTGVGTALERAGSGRGGGGGSGGQPRTSREQPSRHRFSQTRASRVRGHRSLAAGMWGSRWGFRWDCRHPTVSGGGALCEEHGVVGRRQAV